MRTSPARYLRKRNGTRPGTIVPLAAIDVVRVTRYRCPTRELCGVRSHRTSNKMPERIRAQTSRAPFILYAATFFFCGLGCGGDLTSRHRVRAAKRLTSIARSRGERKKARCRGVRTSLAGAVTTGRLAPIAVEIHDREGEAVVGSRARQVAGHSTLVDEEPCIQGCRQCGEDHHSVHVSCSSADQYDAAKPAGPCRGAHPPTSVSQGLAKSPCRDKRERVHMNRASACSQPGGLMSI